MSGFCVHLDPLAFVFPLHRVFDTFNHLTFGFPLLETFNNLTFALVEFDVIVRGFASFEQESSPSAWANEFEPPPHATEYHESHFDSHQKLRINGYLLFYHTGSDSDSRLPHGP